VKRSILWKNIKKNRLSEDEKAKETVKKWFKEADDEFIDTSTYKKKLMPRLQKCIDPNDDYVENDCTHMT